MAETGLVQILEGALMAAGEALSIQRLAQLFDDFDRPANADLRDALEEVGKRCEGRGYELVQVAGGYRFQVRQNLSTWVGRLWQERPPRYSRALLETLSLIAYRQPITRGEIEEIRGVAVSTNIIKKSHGFLISSRKHRVQLPCGQVSLQFILELTHITRPFIVDEALHYTGPNRRRCSVGLLLGQEVLHQQGDVLATLS